MHYYRRSDFVNPTAENDFSTGSIPAHMLRLALPMTLAQLINVLYNIIDRIFIGRIPFDSTNALTGLARAHREQVTDLQGRGGNNLLRALTGLGVAFPICTITIAFANLVGMGGAPLFSIERGKRNDAEAEKILGNSFVLLLMFGLFITITGLLLKRPLLYLLGASEATFRCCPCSVRRRTSCPLRTSILPSICAAPCLCSCPLG